MNENAGNNIQNHQVWPIADLDNAIEMNKNATPMKIFLNDWSNVTSLPRLRLPSGTLSSGAFTI